MLKKLLFYKVLILTSCSTNDCCESCVNQYTIKLNVKDKNYVNILDYTFIKPLDESLLFREYDSNIAYTLKNIRSGTTIFTYKPTMVKNNSKEYLLSFNSIPEGKYLLTVWGNVTEENFLFGYLHPKEQYNRKNEMYTNSKRNVHKFIKKQFHSNPLEWNCFYTIQYF